MAQALLLKIASLFLIMFGSFLITKLHILRSEDSRVISLLMLYMVYPCNIISAFQIDSSPELRSGLLLAFLAGGIIQMGFIALNVLFRKPLHLSLVEQTSVIYSNSGNLIIPLVTALIGPEWVVYTCAYISIQVVLFWTHCKTLISGDKHADLKRILLNVNMLSIFIGILLFAFDIKLPSFVYGAMNDASAMTGPMAMLVIGVLLAGMDIKSIFCRRRVWLVAALRLIVLPLLCVAFLRFSGIGSGIADSETILLITLLAAASPTASMITQMEQIYGREVEYACSINIVTTLLCILTMPLTVILYQL